MNRPWVRFHHTHTIWVHQVTDVWISAAPGFYAFITFNDVMSVERVLENTPIVVYGQR